MTDGRDEHPSPQMKRQVEIEGMLQELMEKGNHHALRFQQEVLLAALMPDKQHYPRLHARNMERFLEGMSEDMTDVDAIMIGRRLEHVMKCAVAGELATGRAVTLENVVATLRGVHQTLDKGHNGRY